jgi:hypothetical protein
MFRWHLGTIACLALVAVLISAVTVVSADEDEESNRSVCIQEETDGFHISSSSLGFVTNDRFDLKFEDGTLSIWYEEILGQGTVPGWGLDLEFKELTEFTDNGNGYLDSEDQVLSSLEIDDAEYAISYQTEMLPGGGNMTTIRATYADNIFSLIFVIATSTTLDPGAPQSPCVVGLGIEISNYPFSDEADHLGLRIEVESDIESEIDYEEFDDGAELNLTKAQMGGSFKWSDVVIVDGMTEPVTASWDGEGLWLSYSRGTVIQQNSSIGVKSMAALSGLLPLEGPASAWNPIIYGMGLVLAASLVGGAVIVHKRRNG